MSPEKKRYSKIIDRTGKLLSAAVLATNFSIAVPKSVSAEFTPPTENFSSSRAEIDPGEPAAVCIKKYTERKSLQGSNKDSFEINDVSDTMQMTGTKFSLESKTDVYNDNDRRILKGSYVTHITYTNNSDSLFASQVYFTPTAAPVAKGIRVKMSQNLLESLFPPPISGCKYKTVSSRNFKPLPRIDYKPAEIKSFITPANALESINNALSPN